MKKLFALLLAAVLLLTLTACAGSEETTGSNKSSTKEATATNGDDRAKETAAPSEAVGTPVAETMPTVLNPNEYILYQNIFYSDAAEDYLGKTATKEGTLARVSDAFSGTTRYYVWGYLDATKCCDWQWEFVPNDPDSLPPSGSLIKMTGTMTRADAALDGIWFAEAEVEVETLFEGAACDVDMTTMNATLERVQLLNMQYRPDNFRGKTLRFYGRVFSLSAIQHPYYDGAWTQELTTEETLPAIGTMVIVTGSWQGDKVQAGKIEPTSDF